MVEMQGESWTQMGMLQWEFIPLQQGERPRVFRQPGEWSLPHCVLLWQASQMTQGQAMQNRTECKSEREAHLKNNVVCCCSVRGAVRATDAESCEHSR